VPPAELDDLPLLDLEPEPVPLPDHGTSVSLAGVAAAAHGVDAAQYGDPVGGGSSASFDFGEMHLEAPLCSEEASLPLDLGPVVARESEPRSRPDLGRSSLKMTGEAAPLLMDVNPHSLGVETVAGICEHVIR